MSIGNRLKQARLAAGLNSQKDLAAKSGVSQQLISKLESGRQTETAAIVPLAVACGVRPEWLHTGQGPMREGRFEFASLRRQVEEPDELMVLEAAQFRRVPVVSWTTAGQLCPVADPYPPGVAERWVYTDKPVGPHAFALEIKGDSMENPRGRPTFPDGCTIILDPSVAPDPGRFAVVRFTNRGEATFKQIVKEAGRTYLRPLNPQWPTIQIDEPAEICGVWVQTIVDSD